MEEKSLNIIGYFSIGIIILSLFYLGTKITGRATDTGVVNVTVERVANIKFSVSNINFGLGSVNNGEENATIDTLGNVINGNWSSTVGGLRIENLGNVNVSLQLKSGKTALQFFGGTNPAYYYMVSDKAFENGSCINGVNLDTWINVNTTGYGTVICNSFSSLDSHDEIDVNIRLVIPNDAVRGYQTDTIIATGTALN